MLDREEFLIKFWELIDRVAAEADINSADLSRVTGLGMGPSKDIVFNFRKKKLKALEIYTVYRLFHGLCLTEETKCKLRKFFALHSSGEAERKAKKERIDSIIRKHQKVISAKRSKIARQNISKVNIARARRAKLKKEGGLVIDSIGDFTQWKTASNG